MHWKITYYNRTVYKEIEALPAHLLGRYGALTSKMIENGPDLGMPYTRSMGSGLFEIRLKSQEGIARVFFCTIHQKNIVMLHSFVKKSQATPKKELNKAISRMKEVKRHAL